jgi:uncharacterized protein (TIGR02001 family)
VVVSPWDFTVGGGITSNYLFRGISQSNNGPSGNVNAELRYTISDTWQLYVGAAASSIKLTNQATSPSVEIDAIGGVRATIGSVTVDVGGIYYIYPYNINESGNVTSSTSAFPSSPFWITNPSWYEGYAKVSFAVSDAFTLGINAFVTPSYLDFGSSGTYLSGTAKYTIGDFALSGEFGRQWMGNTDVAHAPLYQATAGSRAMPDYNYWNAGVAYTYKVATLDLRYHGTDMSKAECALITGSSLPSGAAQSKYCGTAVVGTLSFALASKDLK